MILDLSGGGLVLRGGEGFLRTLEPLGYTMTAERLPLDGQFKEWGASRYYRVKLTATLPLHVLLWHLYVLLPVAIVLNVPERIAHERNALRPDRDFGPHVIRQQMQQLRSLALREFALGVEGLERFVRREPLRRVHECVFGVLALESEPVDPRL